MNRKYMVTGGVIGWLLHVLWRWFTREPLTQDWQLGITVSPAEATATIEADGRRIVGLQDGTAHRVMRFTKPPCTPNAAGLLIVQALGYKTGYRSLASIGPDRPTQGDFPYWPELPAMTLEREVAPTTSWQLGLSVEPSTATAYIEAPGDDGDLEVPGAVDGGGHRLFRFSAPPVVPNERGTLVVEASGYASAVLQVRSVGPDTPADGYPNWPELPAVTLVRAVPTLSHLRINGVWFETEDGAPWLRLACSDFALLRLMHEGLDITAIVRERRDMGFNELRVFSMMCGQLGRLMPTEIPDYYTTLLPEFLDLVESEGMRVELTSLVDANDGAHWSQQQRLDHHNQCAAILAGRQYSPHFCERVNENDQGMNATSMDGFTRPTGVWSCSGSYGADVIPPNYCEQWDYGTIHPARPPDWPRKAVHNPMEDIADRCKIPATANELCRPDQGRGPLPADHFDAGAGISLLHNGGCFHCETGKFSTLFANNETERGCATEYIRGARTVPLSYRYGQYTAGHLSEMPIESHPAGGDDSLNWNSRAYARITGNTSCAVVLQRTDQFVPHAINGWTIEQQIDSVFLCTRPG